MKKILLSLLTFLLAGLLVACNTGDDNDSENNDPMEETAEDTNGRVETDEAEASGEGNGGFLWKVEHGDTEMYLQGTIHLGHDDFYPLDPAIEEAFESADVVLPEFNMLEVDISEEELMDYVMFSDDTTLEEVLSEDTYEELGSIFESAGMDVETLNDFEPWYVEMMLLQIGMTMSNVNAQDAVDLYFLERAIEDDKEIIDLESPEQQFQMLTDYSMETQVQTLEKAVQGFDSYPAELDELAEDWLAGDIEAMRSMSEEYEEADINDEYWTEINDNRNIDMADTLDEILQDDSGQTYFVFVGTAHLTIDPSIVTELEDKGYQVEHIY
ncbi:TraB/GumN family protein [Gracilibacillus alcaliphilus]|uniref:TraB/GumN family protein n=1 Tax=Gracilibacillus alcaliphilus TaxID=1401441 RepID=UPI00195B1157|nr:TraB/GumN family protein [Gracilibacillus alcaliphilus]MBM7675910.1 uncharacterized protein YbaP (TraB family) [Gracilibacillus alcaliphilus]